MTLPRKAEDWPRLFAEHINAGDLDTALDMYDSSAKITPPSGNTTVGIGGIRQVLAGLIDKKARFKGTVTRTVSVGDVAVLYTDWQVTMNGASDGSAEAGHKAIEVLRLQTDGTWKLIVGDPNGRD